MAKASSSSTFITGIEREIAEFPTPDELWARLRASEGLADEVADRLLTPAYHMSGRQLRYYQEIAVNRAIQAVLQGRRRNLLTMATGTGKTEVAFQICWKLSEARWNRSGEHHRPRILYLADRKRADRRSEGQDVQAVRGCPLEDPGRGDQGPADVLRDLSGDRPRRAPPWALPQYPPHFFDLIIVDECHRGSASDESNWREILEYFEPAYQIGMTATPQRKDNVDTYRYFGDPIYTYSLRQGIDDGFLAPYRVHRVITTWDAAGWRPSSGDLDRYGREIPDEEYQTKDFERVVSLRARTDAVARHPAGFMRKTDRFAKTIVFCVDQEHADEMRRALSNLNADLVRQYPDYVCRVTADEGDLGRGHLSSFQDLETPTPTILTTSQMLTTGVDAPTCKNVVLLRVINAMTEFKQIIGRGTRVRDDYGKLWFNILDYTGSATRLFADPEFDGDPAIEIEQTIDEAGEAIGEGIVVAPEASDETVETVIEGPPEILEPPTGERRKFYFDGGQVEIAAHLVHELDPDGKQLRVVSFVDYTAEKVRTLYASAHELREAWADPRRRSDIIARLAERGIEFDRLADEAGQPDADPLDLLCHIAFNAPLRTRRERARYLRSEHKDFFDRYGPDARAVLDELLEKYAEHGAAQFVIPDVLQVPPINRYGNVIEIANLFGGIPQLREAVAELQTRLYAA
jgi:type I restriction enzyme R subunit